jgi:hypothetical protein
MLAWQLLRRQIWISRVRTIGPALAYRDVPCARARMTVGTKSPSRMPYSVEFNRCFITSPESPLCSGDITVAITNLVGRTDKSSKCFRRRGPSP